MPILCRIKKELKSQTKSVYRREGLMSAFIKCKVTFGENRICLKLGQFSRSNWRMTFSSFSGNKYSCKFPDFFITLVDLHVMFCAISYHLYNLENLKNTHGGMLLLSTSPWVFFTLFNLCKWYQIAQRTTDVWRRLLFTWNRVKTTKLSPKMIYIFFWNLFIRSNRIYAWQ